MKRAVQSIRTAAGDVLFPLRLCAGLCALLTLFVLPVAYRNFFFDINRCKVEIVLRCVPVLALLAAASLLYTRRRKAVKPADKGVPQVMLAAGAFAAACLISGAMRGFEEAVLYGNEGRYSGMLFLLCCVAAFCVISCGRLSGRRIQMAAILSAALVAGMGLAHVHGIDPLGFYHRLQKKQIHQFISTIGNIDFYGSYLSMLLPLAGGMFLFSDKRRCRYLGLACSLVIMPGIMASRTDSSFLTMHLGLYALFAFCGGSYHAMARAALLAALGWASLPLTRFVLTRGAWEYDYTGIFRWLCDSHAAWLITALLCAVSLVCLLLHRTGTTPIGQKRLRNMLAAAAALAIAAAGLLVWYFTVVNTEQKLGVLEPVLRFDDHWGTRRGYAYRCALEAIADYSPSELLFGKGVDLTKRILKPYFDKPRFLVYGVFNDAHCQPLQFMLTTGLVGCISLIAFHTAMMKQLLRRAQSDALCVSCLCALIAYIPIALLHVAQPILLITYFSLAALGMSRIMYLTQEEGIS